ncbi:phosphotransferase family protein [Desertibacillus haloalkaliphilus]|uniref:phosphotransferase family protein n=1 Tax=Desertibacillus haloalkaliphilus TaxID=1328930 RepID=UPI001FE45748|nr:phosphotransferase family protein [Desertibacillus haloalkaliphilus]
MELFLGDGWQVKPAGGATGEAYIAWHGDQKLFLKRNSSPFLAVLSAEGIVPKLLWTKRLENGDVITAQRWIQGRELKSYEMTDAEVAQLLRKIHHSSELLHMFKRIGNEPLTPKIIVRDMIERLSFVELNSQLVDEAVMYLVDHQDLVNHDEVVVCHCDVNHNNWILSEVGDLYLIDWDGATVADPALDLGLLLYLYVPQDQWAQWLSNYGIELTDHLKMRMHWYVISQTIFVIIWHLERNEYQDVKRWEEYLIDLLKIER